MSQSITSWFDNVPCSGVESARDDEGKLLSIHDAFIEDAVKVEFTPQQADMLWRYFKHRKWIGNL